MPRPFGGMRTLCCAASSWGLAGRLAAGAVALMLVSAMEVPPAVAAGDDEPDAADVYDDDSGDAKPAAQPVAKEVGKSAIIVEGLMYGRSDIATYSFTTQGSTNKPYVAFTSRELAGDEYTWGARGTLEGAIFDQPFEFSGFFMNPINLSATKLGLTSGSNPDTDTVYDDGPGSDIVSVNSDSIYGLSVHFQSKLYGAEVNAVRPFGIPGLLIGARTIYFGEQLGTTTFDSQASVPWLGTANLRDHVSIATDNRLVGAQIGLEHMFELGDFVRAGGSIKAGLFNNFADRERTYVSENRLDRSFGRHDSDNVFSQAVEINPRLEFKLAEGTYLTASGQFLWLNNVSTALPHYATVEDLDGDHDLRAKDDVYFYGGSLGLRVEFDPAPAYRGGIAAIAGGPSYVSVADVEDRVAELEEGVAVKGNRAMTMSVSGWINRMIMAWDDGAERNTYVVDNTASRSRINFEGGVQIARGWSAGYFLSIGLDDAASNDPDQLISVGENQLEVRHSAWWVRNNQYGQITLGLTSPATDNIILKDVGGIMPGAANIATIGGSLILRRADYYDQGDGALVTRTTLNDISAGASVDTLRRNVVRYDAPRFQSQFGNVDLSAAWGEDDFYDAAIEYGINYNDWKYRFGAGYLHDTDEGDRANSRRDREEYKGSTSLLHVPSGLFATIAYMRREFHGYDTSDQAVFGENTVGLVTPVGSNRPPIDYVYSAFGQRRAYFALGDTSVYGEYAQVDDAVTGLREGDVREVTRSKLTMLGAAICQDIDAAAMDVYAGFRYFTYDVTGVQVRSNVTYLTDIPYTDLLIGYAGTRIKF